MVSGTNHLGLTLLTLFRFAFISAKNINFREAPQLASTDSQANPKRTSQFFRIYENSFAARHLAGTSPLCRSNKLRFTEVYIFRFNEGKHLCLVNSVSGTNRLIHRKLF